MFGLSTTETIVVLVIILVIIVGSQLPKIARGLSARSASKTKKPNTKK